MAFTNNVMIVRHGLLAKLVKLWKENRLLEEIDRLPIELSPRKSKVRGRCCVHKERAVWKYKNSENIHRIFLRFIRFNMVYLYWKSYYYQTYRGIFAFFLQNY